MGDTDWQYLVVERESYHRAQTWDEDCQRGYQTGKWNKNRITKCNIAI